MRIHQLLDGFAVAITNEDQHFIKNHGPQIRLSSLNEHDLWLAQNLVRKNVYKLTNDGKQIILNRA